MVLVPAYSLLKQEQLQLAQLAFVTFLEHALRQFLIQFAFLCTT